MASVRISSNQSRYGQDVSIRQFQLMADELASNGGNDAGPKPFEWILAGLGSCQAITIKMYAERKGWKLENVVVDLSHAVQNHQHIIQVELGLMGDLDDSQRQRLLAIAGRCPVHRLLTTSAEIHTQLNNRE